ncbi:MAG TPA: zinc ribbon domain-containing protein [Candidatus Limnocylindria bacterium]|nr:zinc ribbon domain-containing protein [Candidatus Limnocylindria bacterium]
MNRPDPSLDQQGSVRSFLRVGGLIALGIGILLTIGGMASFFSAFGTFEQPRSFWMAFIGLPLTAVGGAMVRAGFLGPAARYVTGEVTPVLQDTLGALGIRSSAQECVSCGARNDADSRFCDSCGKPLSRACPSCAAQNDADARFCDGCGKPLTA